MNEKSEHPPFPIAGSPITPLTEKAAGSQDLPSAKKKVETLNNASSFGSSNQPKAKTIAMNALATQILQGYQTKSNTGVADNTNLKRSTQMTIEEPVGKTIYFETREQIRKKAFFLRVAILLIIINLLLIANAFSQLVTINNVTITNTTQITAKGDVLFINGATSANNGTIDLTGNFINNSGNTVFGTSSGTVIMNGAAQQIEGTSVTHFNNLTLQNTGSVTLEQDVLTGGNNGTNSGVLAVGASRLDLNTHELTVNNASAGAISRTTGFIVSETDPVAGYGTIRWMVENNTGNYVFPFGNAVSNHYVPVQFEVTTPGTGSNGYISMATYPTVTNAAPNNRPLPAGLTSLLSMAGTENASNTVDRWWVMDVAGYTDKPVSSVTLSYRDSEWDASNGSTNTITENLLQAQSNDGSVWDPFTMGTANTTINAVTVSGINNYNPFWTLVGSNNPLPIELLIFDARLNKNREVDLNWITAAEKDNDFFTVERSLDGINFETLGYVDGAGNSSNNIHYTFVDEKPFEGVNYYRLKQTDFDGESSHSEIKAVRLDKLTTENFSVYPNPVADHFYVNIEGVTEGGSLYITDMKGKVVREIEVSQLDENGSVQMLIQRNELAPGVYAVSLPGRPSVRVVMQ